MENKYKWYKIADNIAGIYFSSKGLIEMEINGKTLCLGIYKGNLFACMQKCPHAGGRMVDGCIDSTGNIICPVHRYKYDLRNGCNISGEGYYLKTYPIQLRKDGILVGFPEGRKLNKFK